MFHKKYEDRLQLWSDFRESLETSDAPLQDVIDFYNQAPTVSIATDPYNRDTWPDPWQLIEENQYCEFCRVLGMCYSLQLTDRFSESVFEIHIGIHKEVAKTHYLLYVNDTVIGYEYDRIVDKNDLPQMHIQNKYTMSNRN